MSKARPPATAKQRKSSELNWYKRQIIGAFCNLKYIGYRVQGTNSELRNRLILMERDMMAALQSAATAHGIKGDYTKVKEIPLD